MSGHRWSGWPGAWCLDCGCDDPIEVAIAEGKWNLDAIGEVEFDTPIVCPPCPEPGSKRFDPYARKPADIADRDSLEAAEPAGE